MTDREAMDVLSKWVNDVDPTLNANLPPWVWDLMAVLDDVLDETGR